MRYYFTLSSKKPDRKNKSIVLKRSSSSLQDLLEDLATYLANPSFQDAIIKVKAVENKKLSKNDSPYLPFI